MYIKDGSDIDYHSKDHQPHHYAWGWLGNKVESSGWSSPELKREVVSKLKSLGDKYKIYRCKGIHVCEMCHKAMGNADIRISYAGKIFAAPSDVVHYIEDHDYRPDSMVVEAVLNGYYLGENDLSPDWDTDRTADEFQKEAEKKIQLALLKGSLQGKERHF